MAIKDAATVIATTGHVLLADTTATAPTLATVTAFAAAGTIPNGWTNMGHTSQDDPVKFSRDGGDTEVKGSWQNSKLREFVTKEPVEKIVVQGLQMKDNEQLTLYYGTGADISVAGQYGVPNTSSTTEKSVLVIIMDSQGPLGLYIPKASIGAEDSIEFAQDDFAKIPIKLTPLIVAGKRQFYWLATGLGAP